MFTSEFDERISAIKPMSCPCHIQIFNQGLKSYRDLPLKMAEFGTCHRNESSGALHGLLRVRALTQDDGHIFCTEEQISAETVAFCKLLREVYLDFGFTDIKVKFSDRPANRAGSDATWDKAEEALRSAVIEAGIEYTINPGEGAFYGPKLEFVLRDAIGRDWQCGTIQVDFVLPERLEANYIAADGKKYHPVMLHRAIFGTLERFIGILIEQYAGKFPLWLAPEQIVICTITSEADEYAKIIKTQLDELGVRSKLDISNEKINNKIRIHSLQKIPIILTVGKKELLDNSVSVRILGEQDTTSKDLGELISELKLTAFK
jgi:threonyl-tRNA synthetase